jgi:uncharacterized repeat protein (TIGR03803 family)
MKQPILATTLVCAALVGPVAALEAQTFPYEKVHVFGEAGVWPTAQLIRASDGTLYGTAAEGGASNCGMVFRMASSGPPVEVLHTFNNSAQGCVPSAGLLEVGDGLFVGMTEFGGKFNAGTLFTLTSAGDFTLVYDFGDTNVNAPARPQYALIPGTDGFLYGTSLRGGLYGWGTAFRVNENGVVEVLHSFGSEHFEPGPTSGQPYSQGYVPPPVGAQPSSALLQASDGTCYGMTSLGGQPNDPNNIPPVNDPYFRVPGGTVFRLTPPSAANSDWSVEYKFNFHVGGGNGDTPYGGLIQTGPYTFYGTTSDFGGYGRPGASQRGTIFQLDTSPDLFGLYTVHAFDGTDGGYPFGGFTHVSDARGEYLYGTTVMGGTNDSGVVFRMDLNHQVMVLHRFDRFAPDAADAAGLPNAPPIVGVDGSLYGTAAGAFPFGGYLPGTLYRLHVDGRQVQTITFNALSDKTFGDADFTVVASSSSSLPLSFEAGGDCTVTGSSVHLTRVGRCIITAYQFGDTTYAPALTVQRTFNIAKRTATLALSNLNRTFDGTPKSATVTTTPSGLSVVTVTYNGSTTAPSAVGSYAVVASLVNDDYQAANATGTLVISPSAVSVTLSASSVAGGTSVTATVMLDSPAPNGGAVVALTSSAPAAASVPASVSITKGKTTKTFTVTTVGAASATTVTISATYDGTTATAQLTVNPAPPAAVSGLAVNPKGVVGGNPSNATVTLDRPAQAGGVLVTMTSSMPSVVANTSVLVPAGSSSATVALSTSAVSATTSATITATAGGVSKSATLTVRK